VLKNEARCLLKVLPELFREAPTAIKIEKRI